jgi:sugar phosphate isomerase/epimerase
MLGCNTVAYRKSSLERALSGIVRAGFRNVEIAATLGICDHIMPEKMTNQDYDAIKKIVNKLGLNIMSIAGQLFVDTAGVNLVRYNIPKAIELTKYRIDAASYLGATRVNISAGEADYNEKKTFYANMKTLGDYAQSKGITIGIETNRSITMTGKKAIEVMKNINHPNVGINYDTGNIKYFANENPEEDLETIMPYVVHMHLKDIKGQPGSYEVTPLGEGDIDFERIFNITDKYGFKGPFSVEVEFEQRQTPPIAITESMIDDALKKSYEFLKRFGLE